MPFAATPTESQRQALRKQHAEFACANFFCRRALLEAEGGFDERFVDADCSDNDLHFRLLARPAGIVRAEQVQVTEPMRQPPWGASVSELRHSVGQALLFKKHPQLYRQKIRGSPPWDYYAIVAVLLLAIVATVAGSPALAAAGVLAWLVLTARLCQGRLKGTSRSLRHVAEIVITSVLIPPLAVFWRLTGALRTQLVQQQNQLLNLEAQRKQALEIEPELARLARELNTTERNYALYVDNLEKSRIDRELDNSQISNIAVIEEATLNPGRIFPKTLVMLFLAIPFAIVVGLLVIYLCYLMDQRIHDGGLVERKFGLRLWSTLPELDTSTVQSTNAFHASIYRLYSQLKPDRIAQNGLTLGLTSARHGEGVTFVVEQLRHLLLENGVNVRVGGLVPAEPGEVVLLDASGLLDNREAFVTLRRADLIALVVEAHKSTVPVVEHALSILNTAFGKVDGIIINRRKFEVPAKVLRTIAKYRGAF